MTNGLDWVLAFFGSQLAGAAVVPVNTRFTDDEAQYVIDDSESRYVFADGDSLPDGSPVADEELGPRISRRSSTRAARRASRRAR